MYIIQQNKYLRESAIPNSPLWCLYTIPLDGRASRIDIFEILNRIAKSLQRLTLSEGHGNRAELFWETANTSSFQQQLKFFPYEVCYEMNEIWGSGFKHLEICVGVSTHYTSLSYFQSLEKRRSFHFGVFCKKCFTSAVSESQSLSWLRRIPDLSVLSKGHNSLCSLWGRIHH